MDTLIELFGLTDGDRWMVEMDGLWWVDKWRWKWSWMEMDGVGHTSWRLKCTIRPVLTFGSTVQFLEQLLAEFRDITGDSWKQIQLFVFHLGLTLQFSLHCLQQLVPGVWVSVTRHWKFRTYNCYQSCSWWPLTKGDSTLASVCHTTFIQTLTKCIAYLLHISFSSAHFFQSYCRWAAITIMALFIKENNFSCLQLPTLWSSQTGQTAKRRLPHTYHSWQNRVWGCTYNTC